MCTVLLPPGVKQTAVNKYIIYRRNVRCREEKKGNVYEEEEDQENNKIMELRNR